MNHVKLCVLDLDMTLIKRHNTSLDYEYYRSISSNSSKGELNCSLDMDLDRQTDMMIFTKCILVYSHYQTVLIIKCEH